MPGFFETTFINAWNEHVQRSAKPLSGGLPLGRIVQDERVTVQPYYLPTARRAEHVAILGGTGSGKTFFIRSIVQHEIDAGRGFIVFDVHGDLLEPTLRYIAAKRPEDTGRVIVIDPASRECAVGLNPLEVRDDQTRFREVAELTRTLADRWNFRGARTEELLRNALFVLSANGLTLLETALLLSNDNYRRDLLKRVGNQDVREYFELRFDPLNDSMKATVREPALNKLSEFTADPHFRYILGQRRSTFSFDDVLARSQIVLVNLNKGRLGVHAQTFGGMVLGAFKSAIFRRHRRELFTVFADEVQNLVAADADFETLFAESRKFAVGILSANQTGSQLPATLRGAMGAIGTRVFFRLSPEDAAQVAQEIDGGRPMTERLRNLPPRHAIVKSGHYRPQEIATLDVETATAPAEEFLARSNAIYARSRTAIDADILSRRPKPENLREVIDDWE